MSKKTLVIIWL